MKKKESSRCIICSKKLGQHRFTRNPVCKRIKANGVSELSECAKKRNRRYQDKYRKKNTESLKINYKTRSFKSVALDSNKHLDKFKAKEYKRHCLRCDKEFTGLGLYNRICDPCTIGNARSNIV